MMKRARHVSAPQPQCASAQPAIDSVEEKQLSPVDRYFVYLFPVLLFLSMTVQTVPMSIILAAVSFVLCLGKTPIARLCGRLSVPVWGFLAFLVLCAAASVYSDFGSYAYGEFAKLVGSGALGLLLLVRGQKKAIRGYLVGFCAVCGIISLLCIDSVYIGPLFQGFASVMAGLGATSYEQIQQASYSGARFGGIYQNANLTGSLTALAMFVGVYLICTGKNRRERMIAALLTGIPSVAFLISMSRGAILCFAAAAVMFLIFVGKGNRLSLFFTLVPLGISMMVFGILSIFLLNRESVLGTLVAFPCGLFLWMLQEYPGQKAASLLAGRGKLIAGVMAGIFVVGAAVVVLSLTWTKPFVFTDENYLYRGANVVSGETYTFSGEWDSSDEIEVIVYGSTREQELLGTYTTYYQGPLGQASFTIPEGVDHILMQFRGPAGMSLDRLSLSDGTHIPTAYVILPDTIANRLQENVFKDNSFLMRVEFIRNGWALFTQSPILGHGLGATEGLLTSVQPFFYVSLYLHNHILQVMDETGLLGLAAFLCLILGAAWKLLRRLRQTSDFLAATLLTCWVMMNLHGLMEISFSSRMFQCAAFSLLLLAVVVDEPSLTKGASLRRKIGSLLAVLGLFGWLLVSSALLLGSFWAQKQAQNIDPTNMSVGEFMDTMEKLDAIDFYMDQDYKVNLMVNALQQGGTLNKGTASRCARELRETGDFDACYNVAAYYYLPLRNLPEFFACMQEGIAQERSNPEAWNSAVNLYRQAFLQLDETYMTEFVAGVVSTAAQMDEANQVLLVDISLDAAGQAFVNACQTIDAAQMDNAAAYLLLQEVIDQTA